MAIQELWSMALIELKIHYMVWKQLFYLYNWAFQNKITISTNNTLVHILPLRHAFESTTVPPTPWPGVGVARATTHVRSKKISNDDSVALFVSHGPPHSQKDLHRFSMAKCQGCRSETSTYSSHISIIKHHHLALALIPPPATMKAGSIIDDDSTCFLHSQVFNLENLSESDCDSATWI